MDGSLVPNVEIVVVVWGRGNTSDQVKGKKREVFEGGGVGMMPWIDD